MSENFQELKESKARFGLIESIIGTMLVAGMMWLISSVNAGNAEMRLINYRLAEFEKKLDKADFDAVNRKVEILITEFNDYKKTHP